MPDRSDGVNDPPRLSGKTRCYASVTRWTRRQRSTRSVELRPGGAEDCTADACAARELLVRRVDDRIDIQRRDVALHDR